MTSVAIIQNVLPHYRVPVFRALAEQPYIELTLIYGSNSGDKVADSAQTNVVGDMPFRVVRGKIRNFGVTGKNILWHKPAVDLLEKERFDVVIHLFESKWASLWKIRKLQKQRGDRFILWGHGVCKSSSRLINRLWMRMIRIADAVLFYSARGRRRQVERGVEPEKLFVARNSLALEPIDAAMAGWPQSRLNEFRRDKKLGNGPVLLCVCRFLKNKRLDLLLRAAARLRVDYPDLKVVLIGDGPCKGELRNLCDRLNLGSVVLLAGRVIEETELAPWFLSSDLVVVPGAIGLLAVHAHAYGRAVVTCDHMAIHGPEIEILIPGQTGALFRGGDAEALAEVVGDILSDPERKKALGQAAYRRTREDFGTRNMIDGFLQAISYVTGRSLALQEPSSGLVVSGAIR
ncbi:MAG: glycosyltransferase family 4 protein [Planctomycetota bacterium]|nr:glycosyltransferase family 4 protein [Planctomycetota bacterium]